MREIYVKGQKLGTVTRFKYLSGGNSRNYHEIVLTYFVPTPHSGHSGVMRTS